MHGCGSILRIDNGETAVEASPSSVQIKVSQINGCAFCQDITPAYAVKERVGTARFQHLGEYSQSDQFSPREKAALAFVKEATQNRKVGEETWRRVREQFSETEIVELTWLNAAENGFNLQAAVLGIESDGLAENFKENR